jgi:hypothetical protein
MDGLAAPVQETASDAGEKVRKGCCYHGTYESFSAVNSSPTYRQGVDTIDKATPWSGSW